jgi:hypothetical protein
VTSMFSRSNSYLWECMKEKSYVKDVRGRGDLINRIEVAAADVVPIATISFRQGLDSTSL